MSKDEVESRNTSRLDDNENQVFNDKSSDEDEKHTFSLSTKQSSKHKPLLRIKAQGTLVTGSVRVCGDAVLRYFWCRFAKIFILACSTAVFQD